MKKALGMLILEKNEKNITQLELAMGVSAAVLAQTVSAIIEFISRPKLRHSPERQAAFSSDARSAMLPRPMAHAR